MPRMLYTEKEIILCAYAARYDAADFGGISRIETLEHRSLSSIKMKIQNIAAMLDEEIQRFNQVKGLSGVTTGKHGRKQIGML